MTSDGSQKQGVLAVYACRDHTMARAVRDPNTMINVNPTYNYDVCEGNC
jgi:hypothetical protein